MGPSSGIHVLILLYCQYAAPSAFSTHVMIVKGGYSIVEHALHSNRIG